MIYIGIDNGVSGSYGVLGDGAAKMLLPPTFSAQDYTKGAKRITRMNVPVLIRLFGGISRVFNDDGSASGIAVRAVIERPLVNPARFVATGSALRCLEATLIALEANGIGYEFVDSRAWQKVLLPAGIMGAPDLKRASMEAGVRLFPHLKGEILKHKDADGLLIAEWARRRDK